MTSRVTDPSKDVIVDAKVTLINDDTGIRTATSTNQTGRYNEPEMQPGNYRMEVEKLGFKSVVKTGIVSYVQQALEIDFKLAPGSIAENVIVEADQISEELASCSISGVVSRAGIVELVWYLEFNEIESFASSR